MAIADEPAWIIDLKRPNLSSVGDFIQGGRFRCAEAQIASDTFNGAWGFADYNLAWMPPAIMASMMLFMLVAILVILKSRDPV